MDAVHDARVLAEKARAVQQLDRRAAVLGVALVHLAALLVRVHVSHEPLAVGIPGDGLQPRGRHGTDAVRGDTDMDSAPPGRPFAQRVDALQERLDAGVAEASLPRRGREVAAVPAAAVVGGGQQHDLEPLLGGGLGEGESHRVRVVVGRAVGPVVHVVELADGAVARGGHLGVGATGDLAHRRRVEGGREPEHRVAPRPEVVGAVRGRRRPFPRAAQVALERVRVRVGYRRDLSEAGHAPVSSSSAATSTSAAAAASSSSTCSSGAWLMPVSLRTSTIPAGRRSPITPASWPA